MGTTVVAAWLALGGSAAAGTLSLQFTGGPAVAVVFGSKSVNTLAGDFQLTVTDATGLAPLVKNQTFFTFCVDLEHYATTPLTATMDKMSNWAIGSFPAAGNTQGRARASSLGNAYFGQYPTGASNEVAAAYQVAIWELLYESGNDFDTTTGSTRFTGIASGVLTAANNLIASSGFSDAGWLKTVNSGSYGQDYMAPVPDPGSSFGALALSLAALGGLRRAFTVG